MIVRAWAWATKATRHSVVRHGRGRREPAFPAWCRRLWRRPGAGDDGVSWAEVMSHVNGVTRTPHGG